MTHQVTDDDAPWWWLVTWTTFGTWLPGDPRGFQTHRHREHIPPPKKYANEGEVTYESKPYTGRYQKTQDRMTQAAVWFTESEQRAALRGFTERINRDSTIKPIVITVMSDHVHFLAAFSDPIRETIKWIKQSGTKALHTAGFEPSKVWCRGCHMKSKTTEAEKLVARRYVERHEAQRGVVYAWPNHEAHSKPPSPRAD